MSNDSNPSYYVYDSIEFDPKIGFTIRNIIKMRGHLECKPKTSDNLAMPDVRGARSISDQNIIYTVYVQRMFLILLVSNL